MRWNKYSLIDYIPFGFVQDHFFNKNQLHITTKGNILNTLKLPVDVFLVKILDENIRFKQEKVIQYKKHYNIFYTGFSKEFLDTYKFQMIPLKIFKIIFQKRSQVLCYETMEPLPEGIIGSWLCINKEIMNQIDDLYFLHIKEKLVKDKNLNDIGFVKDYMETGAHGILVIELTLPKYLHKEIFVPFVDEYCKLIYSNNKEIHYLEIEHWEYFLDT